MSIFVEADIVAELRADRLITVGEQYWPGATLSDAYIWGKVRAAEADAERRLRVFLEPVEVLPEGGDQGEADALTAAGTRWISEPAYDYSPDFFQGEKWGFVEVRHPPVVSVTSFIFAYPTPENTVWEVDPSWIRVDSKPGYIRLVPTQTPFYAPLSAYVLSAVGGGRLIPQMLRIRYRSGLVDAANQYPDLVDTVKKMAVLRIIDDQFVPSSGSISADGLSESMSFDPDHYKKQIDASLEALRQAIHGVRVMAV